MTQDIFQVVIRAYLDAMAKHDEAFAEKMANPKKSSEQCANYIYNQVRKANRIGWDDAEIFGMAVHYYDEEEIPAEELRPVVGVQTLINTKLEKPKAEKKAEPKAAPKTDTKKATKAAPKKAAAKAAKKPAKPVTKTQEEKPAEGKQTTIFGDYNPFA